MANRKIVLGALGLLGCLSLYWLPVRPVPGLTEQQLRLAQLVQPVLLTLIALFVGDRYAPRVGLGAPLIDGAGKPLTAAIVTSGMAIGGVAALASWALHVSAKPYLPASFVEAAAAYEPPLMVRLLYGSLTEEILMRWGLMSWLLWLFTRFSRRPMDSCSPVGTWAAAAIAALLFGAGHLPIAFNLAGQAGWPLATFVVAANFPLGLAAGLAFARYGIELAMIMHAAAGLTIAALV